MEADRFDNLLRSLATSASRRGLAGLALLGPLSALLNIENTAAKKKKRKKKKCKPKCSSCQTCKKGKCKPKPNGTPCGPGLMCADGTCVVGQGTCATGEDTCAGTGSACNHVLCSCFTTTAEETRCGRGGPTACGVCVNDGDCLSAYGPGAFCARAEGCGCPVDKPNFCREACDV